MKINFDWFNKIIKFPSFHNWEIEEFTQHSSLPGTSFRICSKCGKTQKLVLKKKGMCVSPVWEDI